MKKNIMIIVAFVLGLIISGIGVYAASVASKDVSYGNTNVQDAIDDLYSKVNNIPKDIKIVELGTNTSYNIKELYPDIDYTSLTDDNFFYKITGETTSYMQCAGCTNPRMTLKVPSLSYDATAGILTAENGNVTNWLTDKYNASYPMGTLTIKPICYMIYAE